MIQILRNAPRKTWSKLKERLEFILGFSVLILVAGAGLSYFCTQAPHCTDHMIKLFTP